MYIHLAHSADNTNSTPLIRPGWASERERMAIGRGCVVHTHNVRHTMYTLLCKQMISTVFSMWWDQEERAKARGHHAYTPIYSKDSIAWGKPYISRYNVWDCTYCQSVSTGVFSPSFAVRWFSTLAAGIFHTVAVDEYRLSTLICYSGWRSGFFLCGRRVSWHCWEDTLQTQQTAHRVRSRVHNQNGFDCQRERERESIKSMCTYKIGQPASTAGRIRNCNTSTLPVVWNGCKCVTDRSDLRDEF